MRECCDITANISEKQRRVLRQVLVVNLVMFLAELVAAFVAHSTALLADSVDMLGDAIVYGFSLYVVARGAVWQARGAMLKGAIMAAFAVGVLLEVAFKVARGVVPASDLMGMVGLVALLANVYCLVLLRAHNADDINMRSVWVCSRNDGLGIAALFSSSAVNVIRDALQERSARSTTWKAS